MCLLSNPNEQCVFRSNFGSKRTQVPIKIEISYFGNFSDVSVENSQFYPIIR